MKRGEWNVEQDRPAPTMGGAEADAADDEHGGHVFIYLPDITMETGWSAHRVPEREPKTKTQPMGFRR